MQVVAGSVASTTTLLSNILDYLAKLRMQMKPWRHFPTILKQRINKEAYALDPILILKKVAVLEVNLHCPPTLPIPPFISG